MASQAVAHDTPLYHLFLARRVQVRREKVNDERHVSRGSRWVRVLRGTTRNGRRTPTLDGEHVQAIPKVYFDRPVLLALTAFRPTLTLFPSLRELDWLSLHLDDGDMPLLLGLLGSQMTTIHVRGWDIEFDEPDHSPNSLQSLQSLQSSLAIIASNFPLMEDLELDIWTAHNHLVSPSLLLIAEKLKRLTELSCGPFPVNAEAFTMLGQLNHLTTLDLRLTSPLSWSLPGQLAHGFPSLRHLSFTSTAHNYIRLSAFARFPTAISLHLSIIGVSGQHELQMLFKSVLAQK